MTLKRLVLHPAATEEAEAAARWYRDRSRKAAVRFVSEFNQTIEQILTAPHRWPRGPHGIRKIKLPCFPFLIFYRESDDSIQILAIAHGRRRPDYWKSRL